MSRYKVTFEDHRARMTFPVEAVDAVMAVQTAVSDCGVPAGLYRSFTVRDEEYDIGSLGVLTGRVRVNRDGSISLGAVGPEVDDG